MKEIKCCANCIHFNYDAPRFDQPYPEFYCSKEHWCGICNSEELEGLHNKELNCIDFDYKQIIKINIRD